MPAIVPFRRRRESKAAEGAPWHGEAAGGPDARLPESGVSRRRRLRDRLRILVGTFFLAQLAVGLAAVVYFKLAGALWLAVAQVALLGMALSATAVALRRARRAVAKPLRRLTEASRAVAAGTYDQIVRVRADDEVAELVETFNRMAGAVGVKTKRLGALNDIALALTSSLSLKDILDEIMRHGMGLTRSSAACVVFLEEDGRIRDCAARGLSDRFVEDMRRVPQGFSEEMLRRGCYLLASDRPGSAHALADPARAEGIRAYLCLPLTAQGRRLGWLCFYRLDRDDFDPEEIAITETFAYLAAQAIANARVHAETIGLAETDPLTGLANRRKAEARVDDEIGRSQRTRQPFALALLDIDRFKEINDTYGHPAGDAVLRAVAQTLRDQTREVDLVARIGGEEFLLVLPGTDSGSGAGLVAERIRQAVADTRIPLPDGSEVRCTVSAGIACYPACGTSRERLLEHVDEALYAAKRQGRDQIVFYRQMLARRLEQDPFYMAELLNRSLENIGAIRTAIDAKVSFHGHSDRVVHYALALARAAGCTSGELETLRWAAGLHDIGAIVLPEEVLCSTGPLTEADWALVRRHPALGAEILERVPALRGAAAVVRAHHERYDGSGYPLGLRGEAIPRLARILSIADSYSALTTERPYRPAAGVAEAREVILQGAGTRFDPKMVQIFEEIAASLPERVESPGAVGAPVSEDPPRNNRGGC